MCIRDRFCNDADGGFESKILTLRFAYERIFNDVPYIRNCESNSGMNITCPRKSVTMRSVVIIKMVEYTETNCQGYHENTMLQVLTQWRLRGLQRNLIILTNVSL